MIERIVVDNFKSIQHADVKLQKVNLLIGPNNSGKSNFLKVFETVGQYSSETGEVREFDFVTKEGKKTDIKFYLQEGNILLNGSRGSLSDKPFVEFDNIKHRSALSFFRQLKEYKIYKIVIDKLKQPTSLDAKATSISKNADNIASFLQISLNKYRSNFNRITKDLSELSNDFREIVLDLIVNNQINLGLRNVKDDTFWGEELSEGILYFLALLCIIHQPNPPKLLLLEEPETGIHPRRIKEIIDLIKNLASEKEIKVIMTTHSPLVVDLFADEPECIHVFEIKDGFTEIKNLKTDIIDPINKELAEEGLDPNKDYETTLGQQWVYGFLGGVPA